MPQFRGPVRVYGYITVEGEDMYDADDKAKEMSHSDVIAAMLADGYLDVEIFDDEFPEEV